MIRIVLIILGTLSLILGIIGIILPGLPTTPFLLLTAGLYVRSSDRLYNALIRNKVLGKYILNYQKNKAISLKTKIYSITIMWVMISISAIFFLEINWIRVLLMILGIIGSIVMGRIPTLKKTSDQE